jgi:hypothetical protein
MADKLNALYELPRLVAIYNPNTRSISGTSKVTGREYSFRVQEAWLYSTTAPHPEKFDITLNADDPDLARGHFALPNSCIAINRQGRISVPALDLIPLSQTDLELYGMAVAS